MQESVIIISDDASEADREVQLRRLAQRATAARRERASRLREMLIARERHAGWQLYRFMGRTYVAAPLSSRLTLELGLLRREAESLATHPGRDDRTDEYLTDQLALYDRLLPLLWRVVRPLPRGRRLLNRVCYLGFLALRALRLPALADVLADATNPFERAQIPDLDVLTALLLASASVSTVRLIDPELERFMAERRDRAHAAVVAGHN